MAMIRAEAEEKEKKRADEIWMAEIQAEAEEKKRADEIQMAKVEADKELSIKELRVESPGTSQYQCCS